MTEIIKKIKRYWADYPQTYGDTHGGTLYDGDYKKLGTLTFFERLDEEFYRWNFPLHHKQPFDRLFPYDRYSSESNVLEIGCGMGTMAMNWAKHGVNMTAIDLNPVAVEQTQKRFELLKLNGNVHLANSHDLPFENDRFDYVYSWGVLHHSPNLEKSIAEIMRVTKAGGGYGIMLYNRRSLLHWYWTNFIEGFLHYENHFLDPLQLTSRYTDGYANEGNPFTLPLTQTELRQLLLPYSKNARVKIFGTEMDSIFKLMLPGLGLILPRCVKKVWARCFGWSLWGYGNKDENETR